MSKERFANIPHDWYHTRGCPHISGILVELTYAKIQVAIPTTFRCKRCHKKYTIGEGGVQLPTGEKEEEK